MFGIYYENGNVDQGYSTLTDALNAYLERHADRESKIDRPKPLEQVLVIIETKVEVARIRRVK